MGDLLLLSLNGNGYVGNDIVDKREIQLDLRHKINHVNSHFLLCNKKEGFL